MLPKKFKKLALKALNAVSAGFCYFIASTNSAQRHQKPSLAGVTS